ncbi:hypothetical protein LCGC14_3060220, partial [marine sediment metagenome]
MRFRDRLRARMFRFDMFVVASIFGSLVVLFLVWPFDMPESDAPAETGRVGDVRAGETYEITDSPSPLVRPTSVPDAV